VVGTPGVAQTVVGLPLYKDDVYISAFQTTYTDLALFGELTFNLTSKWSLTGGARAFKQTVSQTQAISLLFDGPQYAANDTLGDEWRRALWKVNTSYHLNDNNLIYATWSQGFRRGGVNALPPQETNGYVTPEGLYHVSPDTADNYEIGAKGAVANRLRYSAAAFYIDWRNIQEGLDLTPLVLPGALNIGDGHSFGGELELDAALTTQLLGHVSYTYNQTKLTSLNPLVALPNTSQPPPPVGGRLPGTPLNSVAVGLEYNIPFAGGNWTLAANAHYQSAVLPALSATVQTVPGFTMVDARVSYESGHWLATFFCNNVANDLGIISYQDYTLFGNRAQAVISTPRTFGLTVAYSFKEH
jgi:iron complex outermembrane recepter protein